MSKKQIRRILPIYSRAIYIPGWSLFIYGDFFFRDSASHPSKWFDFMRTKFHLSFHPLNKREILSQSHPFIENYGKIRIRKLMIERGVGAGEVSHQNVIQFLITYSHNDKITITQFNTQK